MEEWTDEFISKAQSELKAVVDQHVASEVAHDEVIQMLKQLVEKLMAQVTAVPDDNDVP